MLAPKVVTARVLVILIYSVTSTFKRDQHYPLSPSQER